MGVRGGVRYIYFVCVYINYGYVLGCRVGGFEGWVGVYSGKGVVWVDIWIEL